MISGWLVVDKPCDTSSASLTRKLGKIFGNSKAGHAGTLDPLASGLLPIAIGKATKTVPYLMGASKTYKFELEWGIATTTDDLEGQVVATSKSIPSKVEISNSLKCFIGRINQIPPNFSAIKINGVRSYQMARNGKKPNLKSRLVDVYKLSLNQTNPERNRACFEIQCGKGVYVRSIARDLGIKLGTFAHIVSLRRTVYGPFSERMAIPLDKIESLGHKAASAIDLYPVSAVLDDIPALALTEKQALFIQNGRAISSNEFVCQLTAQDIATGSIVQVLKGEKIIALARYIDGFIKPFRVLNL